MITEFDQLRKDIRALKPVDAIAALKGWGRSVAILEEPKIEQLAQDANAIVMPDEDVCHELAQRYFDENKVTFETIFLRWDRRKMEHEKDTLDPDRTISTDALDQEIMGQVVEEGHKSTNIWRRVGAAIVKDGLIIMKSSNKFQPLPHSNWTDGDPRNNTNRGVSIDISTDMHAEAVLIAGAAKEGTSLEGARMYVATFPCPTCAKLIAHSGIAKVYYMTGYAMLDGKEVLQTNNVELIQVTNVAAEAPNPSVWVPYPEKIRKK